MALSLDSIFRPFNEFFVTKFGSGLGASVKFRFCRLPHTFVDSDFVVAEHPELGPSKQLAQEIFSNVIDQIPTLDPDGRNVSSGFGSGLISELYSDEILAPAIPFVPAAVSKDADKQAIVDAFNGIKAEANKRLGTATRPMSLMEGQQSKRYYLSNPKPEMWWDKNAPGVWTPQTFPIEDAAPPPAQPGSGILRMKISDAQMETVIQRHPQFRPELATETVRPTSGLNRPMMMMARAPVDASPTANVAFHTNVLYQMSAMPVDQRREMQLEVAQYQTTQPILSSEVTISFDFCTVHCDRSNWLHDGILNSTSWCVPGRGKGALSANDGHGLPAMPVGFVAVKNLRIQAPWTPEDIANLELSVQFGPFNFDSKVVNGVISHDGIQIVGWMLEDLTLPPNAGA